MIWNKKPFAWERHGLGEITYQVGEKNIDALPLESYSVSNQDGFISQREQFKNGGIVSVADKSKSLIISKGTFAYNPARIDIGSIAYLNLDKNVLISPMYETFKANNEFLNDRFLWHWLKSDVFNNIVINNQEGGVRTCFNLPKFFNSHITIPKDIKEQEKIGILFDSLDSLIALHQRKQKGEKMFKKNNRKQELFWEYYEDWVKVYKEGAVRNVTLRKYHLTLSWLKRIIPNLRIKDLTRVEYQELINRFAECHEKQTTMDFHHQLNAAIEDAVDEGLIEKNPTRKAIIKGKTPRPKKPKYLNQYELHSLLGKLELKDKPSMDWLVLLIAKTGIRFSEAIAVTPSDFDFVHQTLTINKTWDYKENGGFQPTKNKSSIRKIQIDWMVVSQFSNLVKDLHPEKPIFVTKEKIYNSTANDLLEKRCKQAGVPVISIHGLRHTHASILLFAGVSVASVAKRLGHSTMTTTEKVYLHIIQELENKDIDLVMRSLSGLI